MSQKIVEALEDANLKINTITVFTTVILSVGMALMGFYLKKRKGEQ